MRKPLLIALALSLPASALAAGAADETHLGPTVATVVITKSINLPTLSLRNVATTKTVAARDLRVLGADPEIVVTGQVFCKANARLVAAQAIVGTVVVTNGNAMPVGVFAQSPKDLSVAGRDAADVSFTLRPRITRSVGAQAVDLSLNPARKFDDKIKLFAAQGGSAAAYMRETQAFDIGLKVNLIGWCRGNDGTGSVLAGKTYAGVTTRTVPLTILYDGDPRIVDGAGVRGSTGIDKVAPAQPQPAPKRRNVTPPRL